MKSIIIVALLAGSSLMAADSVKANDSGSFTTKDIDGAVLYEKNCAMCHGKKAEKSPFHVFSQKIEFRLHESQKDRLYRLCHPGDHRSDRGRRQGVRGD